MPCPTCDETMQNLGVEGQRIFWCPRCGTIKTADGEHDCVQHPAWMRWPATIIRVEMLADIINAGKVGP